MAKDVGASAGDKPEPRHFDNVDGLLARYETEFADLVKNTNTPTDRVVELLSAIHALRIEKQHQRR